MKATKIEKNQKGKRIALVPYKGAWSVWAESINYKLGDYRSSWGWVKLGLTQDEAEKLFTKRVAGRA